MKMLIFVLVVLGVYMQNGFAQTQDSLDTKQTTTQDSNCNCTPSIPIEIIASQVAAGLPLYWSAKLQKGAVEDKNGLGAASLFALSGSYVLLTYRVGMSAEFTSDCKASYWHAAWIGVVTHLTSRVIYDGFYESKHPIDNNKFNFSQYVAYSIIPSVATVLLFNLFLEPTIKKRLETGLLDGHFVPFYSDNSYGLSYSVKF